MSLNLVSSSRSALKVLARNLASITSEGIVDGSQTFLHLESRYACVCPTCYGKYSKQKLVTSHSSEIKVTEIVKETPNFLKVRWCDEHEGIVPRTPRGYYGPCPIIDAIDKYYKLSLRYYSEIKVWDEPDNNIYKFWNYDDLLKDDQTIKDFLEHFMRYGLAFLRNCNPKFTPEKLMDDLDLTPLLATVYGPQDTVIHKFNPDNHAYSAMALSQHTDLSHYNPPPNVFGLMCVESNVAGGESTFRDQYSAALQLKANRPDLFEILATTPRRHRINTVTKKLWHHVQEEPIFVLKEGHLYRIVDLLPCLDEFHFVSNIDLETRKKWWEGYQLYRQYTENQNRMAKVRLNPGDIALLDNWRVTHGRKAFEERADTKRHMYAFYMNWNHMQGRLLGTNIDETLELNEIED